MFGEFLDYYESELKEKHEEEELWKRMKDEMSGQIADEP